MFCALALFVIFTCIKEQQGEGMQMQGLAENYSSPGLGNLVSGATAPQIPWKILERTLLDLAGCRLR